MKTFLYVAFVLLLCLLGLLFVTHGRYQEGRNHPQCQQFFSMGLDIWMDEHYTNAYVHKTNAFPNVDGDSNKSLLQIAPYMDRWTNGYLYVPGLRQDDPDELVLLYKKQKTKISYHYEQISHLEAFRRKPKRIVASPQLYCAKRHGAYWMTDSEFTNRLQKTLDFLKKNDRPNWESVVKEHTEFMKSIKE